MITLFIIIPTLTLAVMFGIGWPLLTIAREKVDKWEDAPGTRKLVYLVCVGVIAGLAVGAAIFDVVVNYTAASLVFTEFPRKGDKYLTKRLQFYLNDVSRLKRPEYRFNAFQWAYIKFVVKTANRIDKTPHFKIPANLVNYF